MGSRPFHFLVTVLHTVAVDKGVRCDHETAVNDALNTDGGVTSIDGARRAAGTTLATHLARAIKDSTLAS